MMNTVCIIFLEEFHLHFLLNIYTLLFRIPYSGWLQNMHYPKDLPWRRQWQPTPVLLPGKSHGQRNMVGCSPWGC